MEAYFLFFICAIFVIAIIISCVLRCRIISRRRREARLRMETQSEYNARMGQNEGNPDAMNVGYYYTQNTNGTNGNSAYFYGHSGNAAGGGGPGTNFVYNGQQIPRQPGQTVMPATVLMSSANDPNGVADNLVTQLFPQARTAENGPNGAGANATTYVPPNSVFYDRDMNRNTNAEEVYGAATYLPRPPSEPFPPTQYSPAANCAESVPVCEAVPVTVAANLDNTNSTKQKDNLSSDSSTRCS